MPTDRLAIYDDDDSSCSSFGENRDADRKLAITGGVEGFIKSWDAFVKNPGGTYSRVVFDTHGNSGMIFFGGKAIRWGDVGAIFGRYNYAHIFPSFTRVYFDGCNVAEDSEGWLFLQEIAKALCRPGGGLIFGWTSKGYAFNFWGHTAPHKWVHPSGKIRYVVAKSGGGVDDMFDVTDLYPAMMSYSFMAATQPTDSKYAIAKRRLDLVRQ